ncbi:uncharacterized protein LOC106177476 isoform X2 [Lingula anatina]|uniref:Uncharacterized protein LOC106177476 isoform X1 n=1 Tax=Lingula anatina TaxID=7574 RepID=A0A1S3K027_LINAN|nr:uncharacterized protein LOC106177476 isoform X1 [Lingula anatina]XP_013415714.1 uncharacterized protein LOC106177476 isoform X2 [Lingula anatina]|eukprot:XP_013415713.1 uncharacterized protein LOC106177476 isoform X1 [Lingula anatina]
MDTTLALRASTAREGMSLVNKYEALLIEQGSPKPSQDRALLVFQALDDLLPHLGVFTKVMKLIRDDLYDAVYSNNFTSSKDAESSFIQRVPHFSLVQQVYKERHEAADELREQLEVVKEKLFNKHKLYEGAQDNISELKNEIEELKQTVANLEDEVEDKNADIKRLETTMGDEKEKANMEKHGLNCDIADLKEDLREAKEQIAFLSKYKEGYDNLEKAFTFNPSVEDSETSKKPVIATRRAHLINNIDAASKLEEQLLTVENAIIDEFDKFLEEHKQELVGLQLTDNTNDKMYYRQEHEVERVDQDLWVMQERFKKSVDDLNTELELIRQHKKMLLEQLQLLEESIKPEEEGDDMEEEANKPETTKQKESRPGTGQESVLSAGLVDEEKDDGADPFIPHERIFSKYAAMMYSSSNKGKNWHEFQAAKFCPSCGEKTIFCPHKIPTDEVVLKLPHNCTHIKITRPKVRINQELIEEILNRQEDFIGTPASIGASQSPADSREGSASPKMTRFRAMASMMGKIEAGRRNELLASLSTTRTPTPGSEAHMPKSAGTGTEPFMTNTISKLWDDYKDRTQIERIIPLPMALDRAVSLIQQFYSFVLWQDEAGSEEEGYFSILDNLYYFMSERYMKEDITYLTTHDLLSAIVDNLNSDKTIQIFGHTLIGNLDASCIRYVLLIADFVSLVDWEEVEDFRAFASIVFPFLQEDDLETLHMGYTSFSENKISKKRVLDFLMYIILKYREPRFQDMENRLLAFPAREHGQMTEHEFNEAVENLVPLHSEKLRKRLFWEAEAHVQMDDMHDVVPVMRLAQISSYLALLQIAQIIRQTVADKVKKAKIRTKGDRAPTKVQSEAEKAAENQITTYSDIRKIAVSVARRKATRKRREAEDAEMDDTQFYG